MEHWQEQYILNNLRDLTEYIRYSPLFVAELTSKDVLSTADNAELNAEPNRLTKAKYLLEVLLARKNGYTELVKALHETTQTGARDILLIGVLCNLRMQVSCRILLLKEYLTEDEIKRFYRKLSSLQFEELYSCLIVFLENDQPIQILRETIPKKLSYYIPRILCKRLSLNPKIFMQSCPDIFVVSGSDRNTLRNLAGKNKTAYSSDQLDEITAQVIILEDKGDWDEIQELNSLQRPTHLIEYEAEKSIFILRESKGTSNIIRRFLEDDKDEYDVRIAEEQFMVEVDKENCKGVCICDLPGMGKTLLIENLARTAEKENRNIVVLVRLQHFAQTSHTKSRSEPPKPILIQYLSATCSVFSVLVIKEIMKLKEIKTDVFFDGFDEIEDKHLEWTKKFLESLTNEPQISVFVTSRPHMREELQNTLGVISYDILPFNDSNQVDFFTNFWLSRSPKQNPAKLREFADICLKEFGENIPKDEHDIAGIPLICLLIAEIYVKHATRYSRKNAHVNENWISFGKSMFDIYNKYVQRKFEIKEGSAKCIKEVTRVKIEHYNKALTQIFPSFVQNFMEKDHPTSENLDKNILSYGLIHKINNDERIKHQFIHRTIAEFLVAEYAVSNLCKLSDQSGIHRNKRDETETHTNQIKQLITLLFRYMLTTQKGHNGIGMSVRITGGTMPRLYYLCFTVSTVMYFMEHQLKQTTMPKSIYHLIWKYMKITKTRINLSRLIEGCGYQNLVNVLCFVENVVLTSSEIEVISQERLCETMTVIFLFSNAEFGKRCMQFVCSYFSFSLNQIVQVCTENQWLTPLQYACFRRSYDLLDYFLEESSSTEGQCLVHFCVARFRKDQRNTHIRVDMIERLISIDRKFLFERDVTNATPLLHAGKNTQLVKFLIEKGSDILAADKFGYTIGHNCVLFHSITSPEEFQQFMVFLIEDCKAIDTFNMKNQEENTAVYEALSTARNLRTDTVKLMLSKTKINVNEKNDHGNNLLFAAVLGKQSFEILSILIELGANYKATNNKEENLLHAAANAGNANTVKTLLTLGLDPDHKNKFGKIPLQFANCCRCTGNLNTCQHKEIIKLLQNPKSSRNLQEFLPRNMLE